MKKILYIIMAMLSLSAVSPQVVFAQEVDDLQEYLDQLAAKAERSRNARAAVPLATETEIDLSRFSSYKNRTAVLKFAASLNVRITNGTITAASNFSGATPLVEVNGTVTLDASASIDASGVSSAVCTAAVGVKGTGTFNQYAAVLAPQGGAKVTLESDACTWNNYFDVIKVTAHSADKLTIYTRAVRLSGEYTSLDGVSGTPAFEFHISTNASFDNPIIIDNTYYKDGEVSAICKTLSPNTSYYYKVCLKCDAETYVSEPQCFTTPVSDSEELQAMIDAVPVNGNANITLTRRYNLDVPVKIDGNRKIQLSGGEILVSLFGEYYDEGILVETGSSLSLSEIVIGGGVLHEPFAVIAIGSERASINSCIGAKGNLIVDSTVEFKVTHPMKAPFYGGAGASIAPQKDVPCPIRIYTDGQGSLFSPKGLFAETVIIDENAIFSITDTELGFIDNAGKLNIFGGLIYEVINKSTGIVTHSGNVHRCIDNAGHYTYLDGTISGNASYKHYFSKTYRRETTNTGVFNLNGGSINNIQCGEDSELHIGSGSQIHFIEAGKKTYIPGDYVCSKEEIGFCGSGGIQVGDLVPIDGNEKPVEREYDCLIKCEPYSSIYLTSTWKTVWKVEPASGETLPTNMPLIYCGDFVSEAEALDHVFSEDLPDGYVFVYDSSAKAIKVASDPDFVGSDCLEYTYDTTNKTASVKIYSSTEYSGDIVIPKKVKYNGETYSVTSIGDYAFSECSSLTSITIPNSVTSIGGGAFYLCSSLTSINVESGNTKYDSRGGCNAIIETATNTLITGCKNTVIPNSVTSIGGSAFYNCSSLTSITIPNSVTSIGGYAFYGCSSLTVVTNYATTPQKIDTRVFSTYGTLHVPAGCKAAYQAADGWKNFKIVEIEPEISLADVNGMLENAKAALDEVNDILARTKAVYGEVKELIPAEQAASIDKYLADADVASAKFKQSYDGLVAAVSVATSAQYAALYASASELNDAITAFGEGLVSYEIEVVNGLIESGQKALATKLAVLKQGIVGLEAAVSDMQANAALEKRRCGTDFFMVDPAVLKTEEAVAFEASLQQLDEDVDAARTYWNNNFSYVEISTIDEVKAFLAKAEELEVMVTRLNAQKTGLDNEYVLFVKSIDEADIVLPKDGVNYSLQTAAVADKQTPDGFPIQMGYKSNRGSVLTSAGVMQFERASAHTFYLKDDQSNYMILLGEDAAMLGIPSSDGATEWTGKALGNGKYLIKVAGEDFGGLCLNVLGTKVNSEVVASAKSTEWTIRESELDELQAFLNMMSEESYTDEDLANMDEDEKKKAEAEIVYVFPQAPSSGKVQWKEPIVLPQRPGVIRLVGNLPVPVKEDGEWAKDEHPIEVPDGSHLVLDDINFDDTTAGGDHVIHITGEVTININVTLDDDFLNKWLWFVDLGKGGRLHWHPGGNHRPNIKNDEGYVYIEPGSSTGKIENTGEVSIAENTVVDEIDNRNGGTVNQNGGRVIKIINKYVYVFVGGYIDNCENGTGAHFTMTGGSLGNNDVNHKDVVFVNHGKFIFRGGHIGGYGSHLFHHHRGAYLRIEGGDIDDSHVTHFIEAYDDFYMSGGFKPHKPIVINPGVRIHVINDIKYIWNIQFVGGVLPDLRVPFLVGTKLHPLSLLDWRRIGYRLPAHYRWRFRPAYKFVDNDGEGNDEEIESGALEIADENVEDEDDLQAYLDWLASQGEDTSGTGETTDYDYSDTEDEPAVMNLPEKVLYITKYIYIPVGHHVHFKGGEIRPKVKFNDPIFHVPAGGWMHTTDVVINLLDINSDWTLFNVGGYFHFGKGSWLKGWMPSRGHFYDGAIHGHGINIGKDSHFVLDGGRIDNIVLNLQTHIYLNATLTYNLFINPDASILYKGYQLVKPYLNSFGISIADVALMIHPDRNFAWSLGLDKHGCVALYDRISSFARTYDMSEGWSWMSFGVPAESAFMKSFAKQASDYANSLKRIQDARQELIYDDVLGFVGGLESLVPEVGYHVYANKAFDMNVASDNLLMSEDVTLNINKGWNWLGYTPQVALPVDVALSSMTPSEGDLVKAYSGGFATYHNGAWVGDLVIQPGEGLMYKATSDASLRYVATRPVVNEYVPASMAKSEWNDDILPVQWSSPVGKYEMNMSIIANVFDQEGNLLNAEDVVIGAFSGGECRGICMGRNRELQFMTVYGDADADELLEFKVYDKVQNLVYDIDEKVAFGNKLVGTVESPQHLTVSSEITPVETITADAQQNDVYSITGIRQNTGRTNLRSLSRGVYIVNGKKVVVK